MPEYESASGIQAPERRHFAIAIPLLVFIVLVVLLAIGLTRNPREIPSPLIEKLRR